jgi:cytochrome c oxidase subunit 3
LAELLPEQKRKVRKPLLWIGLASIVMAFAGLTSGYVVSRSSLLAENRWFQFALPDEFYYATAVILASSISLFWALRAAKSGRQSHIVTGLWITFILAISFAVLQYQGWMTLIDQGYFFTGENANTAVSWVYVITFLHWLHVISGIIVLAVTLTRAIGGKYTADSHLGLSLTSIFWHFLDGLWIYLFGFLVFIR